MDSKLGTFIAYSILWVLCGCIGRYISRSACLMGRVQRVLRERSRLLGVGVGWIWQ